jgi:hypothetical protein
MREEPQQEGEEAPSVVRGVQLVELENGRIGVVTMGQFNSDYELYGWLDTLWATSQRIKEIYTQQQRRAKR